MSLSAIADSPTASMSADDPYRYLEEVDGVKALAWVEDRNSVSTHELQGDPGYTALYERLLTVFDSKERIPAITKLGAWYYNFWRDADHVRGVMRRTTLEEYRTAAPRWETVIDVDALAAVERENWVWKGWSCRYPDRRRCIVYLSRGGGDATVAREFDLETMIFVAAAESGFVLPEAKGSLAWIDDDHVFVRTDFGPGTLTESGYPRLLKRWTRGTPLASAELVFAGEPTDVSVDVTRSHLRIGDSIQYRTLVERGITFFTNRTFLLREDGHQIPLDMPEDAQASVWRDQLLITLRGEWPRGAHGNAIADLPSGALLAIDLDRFVDGARDFQMLFTPGPRKSLSDVARTRAALVVHSLDEVQNQVEEWTLREGAWSRRAVAFPRYGSINLEGVEADDSNEYFVSVSNPLQPTALSLAHVGQDAREPLKSLPSFFDESGMSMLQGEARSVDGTCVPYVAVVPKGYKPDSHAPTILYGYGGFEIPMLPRGYSPGNGAAWLSRGGVFVVAGIRGGGEFGPSWHTAAIKEHKQRSYDDFIAVAEALIARHITSPSHLGIMGGSNGGLLVGAVAMQRPDLFKAVVCQVPLLDMRRYNRLLAGASWMGEYGNPDVLEEWAYIQNYSPYQNVRAGQRYPRILFTTSTRDDRVHPGHARKMAAKMLGQKHDVLYFENTEGGHAGAANNAQQARMSALEYTFMVRELR